MDNLIDFLYFYRAAEEREEKRVLGLVLLRGENVVSLQIEAAPKAPKMSLEPGPGRAQPGSRGVTVAAASAAAAAIAGVPAGLMGPVRGVGGAVMMGPPGVGAPPAMPGGYPMPGYAPRPPVMPPR